MTGNHDNLSNFVCNWTVYSWTTPNQELTWFLYYWEGIGFEFGSRFVHVIWFWSELKSHNLNRMFFFCTSRIAAIWELQEAIRGVQEAIAIWMRIKFGGWPISKQLLPIHWGSTTSCSSFYAFHFHGCSWIQNGE